MRRVKFSPAGSLPHHRQSLDGSDRGVSKRRHGPISFIVRRAISHTSWLAVTLTVVFLVYVVKSSRSLPPTESIGNTRQGLPPPESIGRTEQSPRDDSEFHIVFSSGCSMYQEWQSALFFFAALRSGQPGLVTRIASGCEGVENDVQHIFDEFIKPMAPERFRLHFTPSFQEAADGQNYHFFNKPFGMKHFLENALGLPTNKAAEDPIVVLMDPDMIILKPFARNNFSEVEWSGPGHVEMLVHGTPMAQRYGFGIRWLELGQEHINEIVPGDPSSPVMDLSIEDAWSGFVVGPPYLATARDMHKLVDKWCEFVPRVRQVMDDNADGDFMAEMYAYVLSAVHQKLPHATTPDFMVSDVGANLLDEGWRHIDEAPAESICAEHLSPSILPYVLHYCQRYWVGDYFFGKRRLPPDFLFSCESPLLAEPPPDAALRYDYGHLPFNVTKQINPKDAKRYAFVLCQMLRLLNEAAIYYKERHCKPGEANMSRTLFLNQVQEFHAD